MDTMVQQAGNVSGQVGQVLTSIKEEASNVAGQVGQVLSTIKNEAKQSQKQTTLAILVAVASLVLAAVALIVSVYSSRLGYPAGRTQATASSQDTAALLKRMEEQNALTRNLVDEQRKQRAALVATQQAAEAATKAVNDGAAAWRARAEAATQRRTSGSNH